MSIDLMQLYEQSSEKGQIIAIMLLAMACTAKPYMLF